MDRRLEKLKTKKVLRVSKAPFNKYWLFYQFKDGSTLVTEPVQDRVYIGQTWYPSYGWNVQHEHPPLLREYHEDDWHKKDFIVVKNRKYNKDLISFVELKIEKHLIDLEREVDWYEGISEFHSDSTEQG